MIWEISTNLCYIIEITWGITMTFNFQIDIFWCLEQLQKDGRITERDKLLVQTTHRQKDELKWHPLQWVAKFNLKDQLNQETILTLNRLCLWLAEKSHVPLFVIDPLKADVTALTSVMSQEFAARNHILAVEVHSDRILIGTDQPFMMEWKNNLERSLSPKKVEAVLLNPEQLQRYLIEYYQVSRAARVS